MSAPGSLRVHVNGETRWMTSDATVSSLVAEVATDAPLEGIAVAVNDEIVPRLQWHERKLSDGDVVEVVRAVAGG